MIKRMTAAGMLLLLAFLAACAFPRFGGQPAVLSSEDVVNTAAARTVAAIATSIAEGKNPTVVVPMPSTGGTPTPTPTIQIVQIGATLTPTQAALPPTTAPNETPIDPDAPCNRATFVRDVTIQDNSTILPNSLFTKTWELRNTGSCAWNPAYAVVFAGRGISMSGAAATPLVGEGEVRPGESALVSVTLRAPAEFGEYRGYWMLRSDDGKSFGTGPNAATPFYVQILVNEHFSFAEHLCSARWSTAAGELPCPGKESDAQGFVIPVENPTLEDDAEQEGPGFLTFPQPIPNGYIVGRFPPVLVPEHSDFRAVLSCQKGAETCYVRFRVTYQVNNGEEQVLGEWNEGYEGGITQAIRDLDMVAGQPVAFNFYVHVAGTPDRSKAIWFFPRITK